MRLILVDRGREFCEVARSQFRAHPEVEVVCGRFEELPAFDCVITAGNSFGLMDAGMDLAVVRFFGSQVMEAIQKQILKSSSRLRSEAEKKSSPVAWGPSL
jgi:hypothetical protein